MTGLSAAANHALISLVQESIQSVALIASGQGRRVAHDDRLWSRASIATDLAAIGAGIAVQRAFAQKEHEPLPRAGIRTGGFWLSVAGTAGGLVGVLHELVDDGGNRARSFGVTAAAAAALAGVNVQLVRRRSRLDADLPPEETQASLAKSIGIGLGVVAGMSAFGAGERMLADAVGHALARVLPGDAAIWRPVGHAAALAGFGYGGALHRSHRLAQDRKRAGVGPGRVRPRAAEPVVERKSREPRSVRHPFPAGACYVWTGYGSGRARRGDGRAGAGGADPRVRRARECADRGGARRSPDARARAHRRVRSCRG